jgi:hypothetical protein
MRLNELPSRLGIALGGRPGARMEFGIRIKSGSDSDGCDDISGLNRREAAIRPNKQVLANCHLMLLFDFGIKNPGSEHTLALYLAHHPDQIECFSHLV